MVELPALLRRAMQHKGVSCFADAPGRRLHYLQWGDRDDARPGLLFVHGYRAHAAWWDFIAPLFAERFRVVLMELSGMGESSHRPEYRAEAFADDIAIVIRHSGLRKPIGIGHSYGGSRLLRAAADRHELLRHVIAVDSYLHLIEDGPMPDFPRTGSRRPYPTREVVLQRFRLSPEQPVRHPALFDHLAAASVREVAGGWTWKFDVELPGVGPMEFDGAALLARVRIPVHLIWGQSSGVVNEKRVRAIAAALPQAGEPIMIPDAHHHLMLDQPLALISTLQTLLA